MSSGLLNWRYTLPLLGALLLASTAQAVTFAFNQTSPVMGVQGNVLILTPTVTSPEPNPVYIWQSRARTAGVTDWTDIGTPDVINPHVIVSLALNDAKDYRFGTVDSVAHAAAATDTTDVNWIWSTPVSLFVSPSPIFVLDPVPGVANGFIGDPFSISATITNRLAYVQWQSSPDDSTWTDITDATTTTLSLVNPQLVDSLYYRIGNGSTANSSDAGWFFSNSVQFVVGIPYKVGSVIQGASTTVSFGKSFTLTAVTTGITGAKFFKWQKADVGTAMAAGGWTDIAGATNAALTLLSPTVSDYKDYRLVYSTTVVGGPYSYLNKITFNISPSILTQPTATTTLASGVTYTVAVVPTTAQGNLFYAWQYSSVVTSPADSDWQNIAGEVYDTLRMPKVTTANSGLYRVKLTNSLGNSIYSNSAKLTVTPPSTKPLITTQPADTTVLSSQTATLSVVVAGFPVPTYKWEKSATINGTYTTFTAGKGNDTTGATSASLVIGSALPQDAGFYRVVATNSQGTVTSTPAQLTVQYPPRITTQPVGLQKLVGANATFTVVADSLPAPSAYAWKKNGGADLTNGGSISGATTASLTITGVLLADAGNYTCIVTNALGTVISVNALLSVTPVLAGSPSAPVVIAQPVSATGPADSTFVLMATVTGSPNPTFQWQLWDSVGGTWEDLINGFNNSQPYVLEGASTFQLTVSKNTTDNIDADGLYRLKATNSQGTVYTDSVTIITDPDIWVNATETNGWYHLPSTAAADAFGYFYMDPETPTVIFHPTHGWLVVATDGPVESGAWYWAADLSWFWTDLDGSAAYPFIFVSKDANWYYYVVGSANPRYFYNYATSAWLTLTP
ncbi:MAG: immunoglobulin domain-containing protein [Verrucomicrobiota bacterium]|nr:immunoglobulin domain-containing protein [Verrucomicrobiota bacterium]